MTTLLLAVAAASLLGGLHCAGMCGPFALWAGTADGRVRPGRLAAYHLGRLATYLAVGALAGLLGRAADASGHAVGLPVNASRAAGVLLIGIAVWKVWPRRAACAAGPGAVARFVAKARPTINFLPSGLKPAAVGAVTVLLPCGWLYAFAAVAAGAGAAVGGAAVMAAFWVGTVPWLSGLTLLSAPLVRWPAAGRWVTAGTLAAAGLYTSAGRAHADFAPLLAAARAEPAAVERLAATTAEPPACCPHCTARSGNWADGGPDR
ncbi:sulfite exporter TauE/SafE family protein [Alienimonas sp. DA493]|uniref:sulfite exporter TauE/SafE family protein n=1 Tax=Alienimonas sp. DA493 TaxID=3373605 RepID=UPI003754C59B